MIQDEAERDPEDPLPHEVEDRPGLKNSMVSQNSAPTLRRLTFAPRTHQSKTRRVQKTPVKRLQMMPMMSVTAKPFTGPLSRTAPG